MKKRLDVLLLEKGLETSRERAKAIIMSGIVYVNNQKAEKSGNLYDEELTVEIRGNKLKYVSRGGLKLEKAIEQYKIELKDKIAMDIGASTGGFTHCMLLNGCKRVFSVDVGYGQLDYILRNDDRVTNMERTNIRGVTAAQIGTTIDFASIDVSFISLRLVLPVAYSLLNNGGEVIALIKPQFEAGREKVGKNGVVRDKYVHIEVVKNTISFAKSIGFSVHGLTFSPIKGPKGNIEYLVYLKKESNAVAEFAFDIEEVVEKSHMDLKGIE